MFFKKNADSYLKKGEKYFIREHYVDAIENFNKGLALEPNHREASSTYYFMGISYGLLNKHSEAIESYKKALQIGVNDREKNITVNNSLMMEYAQIGDLDKLNQQLKAFIEIDPPKEKLNELILWLTLEFIKYCDDWNKNDLKSLVSKLILFIDGSYPNGSKTDIGQELIIKAIKTRMRFKPKGFDPLKSKEVGLILSYCIETFNLLKDNSEKQKEVGRSLHNIGWICLNIGWFEYAISLSKKALSIFDTLPDSSWDIGQCKETIGNAYNRLGKADEGKRWILESLEILNDPKQLRKTTLNDLGLFS